MKVFQDKYKVKVFKDKYKVKVFKDKYKIKVFKDKYKVVALLAQACSFLLLFFSFFLFNRRSVVLRLPYRKGDAT